MNIELNLSDREATRLACLRLAMQHLKNSRHSAETKLVPLAEEIFDYLKYGRVS